MPVPRALLVCSVDVNIPRNSSGLADRASS
jgi:hypothetical protein